ncbi:MAG: SEL1-like repeat protein [Rhizobiales bacterium]|nr:SEL1-like repeat protein [Hyphomicrobiales bacterium]
MDFDAREAAKEAARRAGMSLGEWMNSVIADQAADMGVDVDDLGADDRLEAVTARLSRMSGRDDGESRRSRRPVREERRRPAPVRRARQDERDEDFDDEWLEPRRRARPEIDAERLLDDAVGAFERRAAKANSRTAAALATVADRLGDIEARISRRPADEGARPIRDSLERLEERMEALSHRAGASRADKVDTSLREFGQRLEQISARLDAPAAAAADPKVEQLDRKLGAILEAVQAQTQARAAAPAVSALALQAAAPAAASAAGGRPRSFSQRPIADALADIARRQRDLDGAPVAPAAHAAPAGASVVTMDELDRRLEHLAARLERAAERPAASAAPAPVAAVEPLFRGLQGEISRLADGIETMRREAVRPAPAPASSPDVGAMRREIEAMSRAMSALAPAGSVAGLEDAVRDLARRVDASRAEGASELLVAPIARLADELRANVRALDSRPAIEEIQRGVQAIGQKLAAAGPVPSDARQFDDIRAQTREIRDLVAAALARPAPVEKIERQIGALAERVDRLAVAGPIVNPPEIAAGIAEIRAMMAAAVPSGSLDTLERQIADLSARLDSRMAASAGGEGDAVRALERQIAGLADRLDLLVGDDRDAEAAGVGAALSEIRSLIASGAPAAPIAALERQVAGLAERLDALASGERGAHAPAIADAMNELRAMMSRGGAPAIAELERRIEDLSNKVELAAARPPAVDGLVESLTDRIRATLADHVREPRADADMRRMMEDLSGRLTAQAPIDAQALGALQSEIVRLSDRIDRAEGAAPALDSMRGAMTDLIARMDSMREVALGAAETAARAAAREAVREAMAQGAGADASLVSRDIETLRQQQSEVDRRTHSTLGAVHDTLERIVDRLAVLEDEVDSRPRSAAAAAMAPVAAEAPARQALPEAPVRRPQAQDDDIGSEILGMARSSASAAALLRDERSTLADDVLIDPEATRPAARASATHLDDGEKRGASNFIAAARRMQAQAAAEQAAREAAQQKEGGVARTAARAAAAAKAAASVVKKSKAEAPASPAELLAEAEPARAVGGRSFLAERRRPILIGLTGLTMALGALAIVRAVGTSDSIEPTVAPAGRAIEMPDLAPRHDAEPKAPVEPKAPAERGAVQQAPGGAPALPSGALTPAPTEKSADKPLDKPAEKAAPRPAAAAPGVDSTPVAAIDPASVTGPQSLREAATGGDAAAQYEMASRFADGRGVTRDLKAAAMWFEKAAEHDLAPAQYRLGSLYEKGLGVPRDLPKAKALYQRAADRGNARAMHNLAVLVAEGAGGKPDYAGAAQWFRKAAEFGVRDSQYNLAILYARGLGIEQNMGLSYLWFSAAAKQGDEDAAKKRDEVAQRMDAKTLEQAKAAAEAYRPKTTDRAANEVAAPPRPGWEPSPSAQGEPAKGHDAAGKSEAGAKGEGKGAGKGEGKAEDRARMPARPKTG